MSWSDDLNRAITADVRGQNEEAESFFEKAVKSVQTDLGPYDLNVARCLMTYAQFLERKNRLEDARNRYQLALSIFKMSDDQANRSLCTMALQRVEFALLKRNQ
ncbi:MAG TPA: tetratricopeptide repeat protein [Candidatus Obscuribacterales bacterium]